MRQSTGSGNVYQGRFKSFPIQEDDHFNAVARYTGPASRAYPYYTDEDKRWADGLRVEIAPRD